MKTRTLAAAGALGLVAMLTPAVSASAAGDKTLVCHYSPATKTYGLLDVGAPAGRTGHEEHALDIIESDTVTADMVRAACVAAAPTTTTTTTSAPVETTTTSDPMGAA
jgi:hypothetical protein